MAGKKHNKIRYLLIVLAIILVIIVFWVFNKEEQVGNFFRTQEAKITHLQVLVSATGTLKPVMVVEVGTQVSGTVKEIYTDYNDEVKAGQLLLELDDEQFVAKANQSKASLAIAKAKQKLSQVQYNRYLNLYKSKTVSKEELDEAEANNEVAKATVLQNEALYEVDLYNLKHSKIYSPVNGVVINKDIDMGQTVAASFQTPTLVEIAQDLTKMQIDADFAEADIGRLKQHLMVTFSVDAYPGETFEGQVRQIRLNPTTEQNVVTYNVVVDVKNEDLRLLPGMTAYVDIELNNEQNVLLVPNLAFNYRPNVEEGNIKITEGPLLEKKEDDIIRSIYVLQSATEIKKVNVKVGITDQRQTIILAGEVKAGDIIVVGENLVTTARKSGGGRPF